MRIAEGTLLLLSTCLIISCSDTFEPDGNGPEPHALYDTFVIDVDSIRVPDRVEYGEVVPIQFYGTIGDNDCYSFCAFESSRDDYLVRITAYGLRNTSSDHCHESTVPLREECRIEPSANWLYGYINIEVQQPDGSTLAGSVHVGECYEPGDTYTVPVGEEVEISYETILYPQSFTDDFDPRMLRFIDRRCEYLTPGLVGGPWRCYMRYQGLRPGRTCATLEYANGETMHFTVIVTP
ncbi:MAG TPA: hypothetical protein VMX58_02790 [Patescibacteria group bacterium]|nr:hypothetical protein [Patescibacteria group bacterium]